MKTPATFPAAIANGRAAMTSAIAGRAVLATILTGCASSAVAQNCTLGETRWRHGCEAECVASWTGTNCPNSCTVSPYPGYVIIDYRDVNLSEANGGHSISRIAAHQEFNYVSAITQSYQQAMNVAAQKGNTKYAADLNEQMNASLQAASQFSSSHQTIYLKVNALKDGNTFDRKRGWSRHRVDVLEKCIAPANMAMQLTANMPPGPAPVSAPPPPASAGSASMPEPDPPAKLDTSGDRWEGVGGLF